MFWGFVVLLFLIKIKDFLNFLFFINWFKNKIRKQKKSTNEGKKEYTKKRKWQKCQISLKGLSPVLQLSFKFNFTYILSSEIIIKKKESI